MRRKQLIFIALAALIVMGVASFLVLKSFSPQGPLQVSLLSSMKKALPEDFITHVFSVRSESADAYELKLTLPEGWSLLEPLAPIRLEAGAEEKLFITVQIPPATPPGRYVLSLTAHSLSDPTLTASAQALVKIGQAERLKLRVPQERLLITAGQESRYAFKIINTGNVSAAVKLSLLSSQSGWGLGLSEGVVQLAPGESRELSLIIKVPQNAPSGEAKILLEAKAQRSSDEAALFFTVLPSQY